MDVGVDLVGMVVGFVDDFFGVLNVVMVWMNLGLGVFVMLLLVLLVEIVDGMIVNVDIGVGVVIVLSKLVVDLLVRVNYMGIQAQSTVTNFVSDLVGKVVMVYMYSGVDLMLGMVVLVWLGMGIVDLFMFLCGDGMWVVFEVVYS